MFIDYPLRGGPVNSEFLAVLPKTARLTWPMPSSQVCRDHQVYSIPSQQMRTLRPREGSCSHKVTQLSLSLPQTQSLRCFPLRSCWHLTAFWNLGNPVERLFKKMSISLCYKYNHHFLALPLCQVLVEELSINLLTVFSQPPKGTGYNDYPHFTNGTLK